MRRSGHLGICSLTVLEDVTVGRLRSKVANNRHLYRFWTEQE